MWQLAREFSQKIYLLTFLDPIATDFRFKDQIRGACGYIMDNIAKGFKRSSKCEFVHSLNISKGEVGELKSQLYRGLDNNYFTKSLVEELYASANCLTKMRTSFVAYLNNSNMSGQKFRQQDRT